MIWLHARDHGCLCRQFNASEDSRLSKACSISDLLSSHVASLDREEVVDLHSGMVITEVPSLADLMDYEIDASDMRSDSIASLDVMEVNKIRALRGDAPDAAEARPGPVFESSAVRTTPVPQRTTHRQGRKLSIPSEAQPEMFVPRTPITLPERAVHAPLSVSARSSTSGRRPQSPVPWFQTSDIPDSKLVEDEGASRASGALLSPREDASALRSMVAPSSTDVVELVGRGVLVKQSSRPSSLYGNMDLVDDTPVTMSEHMLTFTQSRAKLTKRSPAAPSSSADLELQLWNALYADGSIPSTSVVVVPEEGDGCDISCDNAAALGSLWSLSEEELPRPPTSPLNVSKPK